MVRRVVTIGWRVRHVPAELPDPVSPLPFVADLPGDWAEWLRDEDVLEARHT